MRLIVLEVASEQGMKMAINIDHVVAVAAVEDRGGHPRLNTCGIVTTSGNYIVKGSVAETIAAMNRLSIAGIVTRDT